MEFTPPAFPIETYSFLQLGRVTGSSRRKASDVFEDFLFLLRHRERPSALRRWLVVWAKRAIQAVPLIRLLSRPMLLRAQGAHVGRLAVVGRSLIVGRRAWLSIGDEASLSRCHLALFDHVAIGRRVVINDGVKILTATHSLSDSEWSGESAPVSIGEYAWIATDAILLPGVTIGKGAVVGAGAVVRCDVPDFAIVTGNPAEIQRTERTRTLSYSPTMLNAPFEAWVGHNTHKLNRRPPDGLTIE